MLAVCFTEFYYDSIFIYKLPQFFNFSSSACNLIYSFLSGRTQLVRLDDVSGVHPLTSGVPQSSFYSCPSGIKALHLPPIDEQLELFPFWPFPLLLNVNDDLASISGWTERNIVVLN